MSADEKLTKLNPAHLAPCVSDFILKQITPLFFLVYTAGVIF